MKNWKMVLWNVQSRLVGLVLWQLLCNYVCRTLCLFLETSRPSTFSCSCSFHCLLPYVLCGETEALCGCILTISMMVFTSLCRQPIFYLLLSIQVTIDTFVFYSHALFYLSIKYLVFSSHIYYVILLVHHIPSHFLKICQSRNFY